MGERYCPNVDMYSLISRPLCPGFSLIAVSVIVRLTCFPLSTVFRILPNDMTYDLHVICEKLSTAEVFNRHLPCTYP